MMIIDGFLDSFELITTGQLEAWVSGVLGVSGAAGDMYLLPARANIEPGQYSQRY
jgi:hypothetical protein